MSEREKPRLPAGACVTCHRLHIRCTTGRICQPCKSQKKECVRPCKMATIGAMPLGQRPRRLHWDTAVAAQALVLLALQSWSGSAAAELAQAAAEVEMEVEQAQAQEQTPTERTWVWV